MTKAFLVLTSIMCALALVACTGGDSKKFVSDAAEGGLMEVELGRLAMQKTGNDAVRNFGMQMVQDHSRANSELKAVAARKHIEVPTQLSSNQKSTLDKLSKLSGADFDKEYMSNMVKDHEADVKEFETQANKGNDPDVKAFAAKTLPTLQKHLQMARDVNNQVSNAGNVSQRQ
jgi:putative membrane protein